MDVPTHDELIDRITTFCERHGMAPATFGREAVNNPALVKSLRLRNPPPNTTITASGLLRLAAPQNVRLTERVAVSIEIETKVGENVLHNISVIALTKEAPTTPPPTSRQPGAPTRRGNARTL